MTNTAPLPARRPAVRRTYPVCSLQKAVDTVRNKCGAGITEKHGKGRNKVLILPEAARELEVMVSYGRRSPMNASEQKFAGYGHFLRDETGNMITVVSHFIEIQTMNRNAVGASNLGPNGEQNPGLDFLAYHREEFQKAEAKYNTDAFDCQVDPFLKLCGASEFVLEGHTHPDLGVFYSGTDRESGAARAASAPVCIFVCDPVRKKMLGSIGKDFAAAEILVFSRGVSSPEGSARSRCAGTPADEIIRLVRQCLASGRYTGDVRVRSRADGRNCLKLKLMIPKDGRGG